MPQSGRRSRNYNAGNTPRFNPQARQSRSNRGGGGLNARRRSTFHGYRPKKDAMEHLSIIGKNIEVVVGLIYLLIVLMVIGWLQFACDWYTARCSDFVTNAAAKNITLPENWKKSDYKGCDKTMNEINATQDTLIYFGLNSFAHLNKEASAYVYSPFRLGEKSTYFWNFGPLLWLLVLINFFGIIMSTVYWSMKSMSMSMMYTSKAMRNMFGPGNGIFGAIGFALSMVMFMDYRYGVKATGKSHVLVLDSLGYGGNFSLFMFVIILYAVIIGLSIALFSPDKEKIKVGKEARKSFKMAVRRASNVQRMSRMQHMNNSSSPRGPRRSNMQTRSSRIHR